MPLTMMAQDDFSPLMQGRCVVSLREGSLIAQLRLERCSSVAEIAVPRSSVVAIGIIGAKIQTLRHSARLSGGPCRDAGSG